MTTAILLLVIGIIVDIFIIRMHRKEAEKPFIPEWKFDENVPKPDGGLSITSKPPILKRYTRC